MLEWTSIFLTVLLSTYVIVVTNKKKKKISCMLGKMTSMTNSMMVSVTIGTILGIMFRNTDLAIPTIISILIGIFCGFFTGKPISQMAILEGITAGIMGGMMGAMLGIMLQETYIDILIYFIDFIYVGVIILLLKVIDKETNKINEENKTFKMV